MDSHSVSHSVADLGVPVDKTKVAPTAFPLVRATIYWWAILGLNQ